MIIFHISNSFYYYSKDNQRSCNIFGIENYVD